MRIVSRRAIYGDADPSVSANGGADQQQVNLNVPAGTAVEAIGVWVLAGVLTHLAIRFVDHWFESK